MEHYKIITDPDKLKEFINWLPELKDSEAFYVSLFARSKYAKDVMKLKADKQQLKRFTSNKEFLYEKIEQLETKVGTYYQNHMPLPQEALSLYITPNPRSYVLAGKKTVKAIQELIFTNNFHFNPHQEALSAIQVSSLNKYYCDLDFDNVEWPDVKDEILSKINHDCLTTVKTRGGFHLLVRYDKISPKFSKSWYLGLTNIKGCDVRGDNLLPVPGTYQGGFTPELITNVLKY